MTYNNTCITSPLTSILDVEDFFLNHLDTEVPGADRVKYITKRLDYQLRFYFSHSEARQEAYDAVDVYGYDKAKHLYLCHTNTHVNEVTQKRMIMADLAGVIFYHHIIDNLLIHFYVANNPIYTGDEDDNNTDMVDIISLSSNMTMKRGRDDDDTEYDLCHAIKR